MNGYQRINWVAKSKYGTKESYSYQVGYLSPEELGMITGRVCKFRNIPLAIAQKNLSQSNSKYLGKLRDFKDIDKLQNPGRNKGILGYVKSIKGQAK